MTRICGIELRSSEAILVVLDHDAGETSVVDIESKKIKLGDDESADQIKSFFDSFVNFARVNHIETLVIKKRAKKGQMAGGAISFKLEALIQLNGTANVVFVSGQGIAAELKKEAFDIPEGLNRYQETAFNAASFYIRKNI